MKNTPEMMHLEDVRKIVGLLGDVIAIQGEHFEQKKALMGGLIDMLGADAWAWTLAHRSSAEDEQTIAGSLHGGMEQDQLIKLMKAVEHPDSIKAAYLFHKKAKESLEHTTMDEVDMDPEGLAFRGDLGHLWKATGFGPTILSGIFIDDDSMSVIAIYRNEDQPQFTPREKMIAHVILEKVTWLHRLGWVSEHGVCIPSLSPKRRLLLNLLLEGLSRKQVADELGVSIQSLKKPIQELYQLFAVHSHPELISKIFAQGQERS